MIMPSCYRPSCYSLAVLTLVLGISGAIRVFLTHISAMTHENTIKPNLSLKLNLLEKHKNAF
jgi:maltodextrin utilization protein YvdJ